MGWQDAPIVGQTKPAATPRAAAPAWQTAPVVSNEPQMPQPPQEPDWATNVQNTLSQIPGAQTAGALALGAAKGVGSIPFIPEMIANLASNLSAYAVEGGLNAVEGGANMLGRAMGEDGQPLFQSYDLGLPEKSLTWKPDMYSRILEAGSRGLNQIADAEVAPNPAEWDFKNRAAFNVADFLASGLGVGKGLRTIENVVKPRSSLGDAMVEMVSRAKTSKDVALRNAEELSAAGKPVSAVFAKNAPELREGATSVGAGLGLTQAQETENPWDDLVMSLVGGKIGDVAYNTATDLPGALARLQFDPNTRTAEAVSNRVANVLQEMSVEPTTARRNIENELQTFEGSGMTLPTSGLMSDDEGLISLEKAVRVGDTVKTRDGDTGLLNPKSAFAKRDRDVRKSATQAVEGLQDPTADTGAPNRFVQGKVDEALEQGRNKISYLENNLQKAADEYELLSRDINTNADSATRANASRRADEIIRQVQDDITTQKNALYKAVDPEGTARVDAQDLIDEVSKIKKQELQSADAIPSGVVGDVKKLKKDMVDQPLPVEGEPGFFRTQSLILPQELADDLAKLTKEGGSDGTVSVRGILNLRTRLSDEIGKAYQNNDGALRENLTQIKQAVDKKLETLGGELQGQAAQDYFKAQDFYAQRFAPINKQGELGKFREATRKDKTGTQTAPSDTLNRFFGGGPEAVQSLQKLRVELPDPKQFDKAVRDGLISEMASKLPLNTKGQIAPQSLARWVQNNKAVLDELPEVKKEVQQMQQDILNKSGKVSELEAQVKAAKQKLGDTEKEIKASAARLFLGGQDPIQAAKGLMSSSKKTQDAAQIKKMLDQDPTGQALKGFRQSLSQEIANRTLNTGGDNPVSLAKLKTTAREMEPILSKFYTQEEIATLKRGQRLLEIQDRQGIQVLRGSATTENQQQFMDNMEIALKAKFGVLAGGSWTRVMKLIAAKNPLGMQQKSQELLYRAYLDPEIMTHLLKKKVTADNVKGWEKELRRLLTLKELGTQSGEDETEEMSITVRPGDKNLPETE